MLVEIICAGIVFYLGWTLGQTYQILKLHAVMETLSKNHNLNLEDISDSDVMFLIAEQQEATMLIYDKLTNDFICQSSSIDEAAVVFNTRRPNTIGSLVYNDETIYFIDGKVTKDK